MLIKSITVQYLVQASVWSEYCWFHLWPSPVIRCSALHYTVHWLIDDGRTWTGAGRTIPKSKLDTKMSVRPSSHKKSLFFKKIIFLKILFVCRRKKNAITLVLPIEEISLRPELSSQARFRIQGGYPERDGGGAGRKSSCLILDIKLLDFVNFAVQAALHS